MNILPDFADDETNGQLQGQRWHERGKLSMNSSNCILAGNILTLSRLWYLDTDKILNKIHVYQTLIMDLRYWSKQTRLVYVGVFKHTIIDFAIHNYNIIIDTDNFSHLVVNFVFY